ncbi:putative bifunctional diguanylate cyclase/phosphodiesterase [Evansella sp. AB-rgal1]|uniref:putative bifunctional diguanylate cyclase/phosphodiesterase n=1 Tax=Evansella sp. AB-rgal1 TaxID=3242696 RepID=UPI00359ED6C9
MSTESSYLSKRVRMTILYTILFLLGLFSRMSPVEFVYGISFSFYSIFLLLLFRTFGIRWMIISASIIHLIAVFFYGDSIWNLITIAEVLFIGLFIVYKKMNNMVLLAGAFWIVLGIPVSIGLYYFDFFGDISNTQLYVLLCMSLTNGVFNALIADMLVTYIPFNNLLNPRESKRNVFYFHQIISSMLMAVIFIPFLLNMAYTSWNTQEKTEIEIQQQAENQISTIRRELEGWSHDELNKLMLFGTVQIGQLQDRVSYFASQNKSEIAITNNNNTVLAASASDIQQRLPLDIRQHEIEVAVTNNLSLFLSEEKAQNYSLARWSEGNYVYFEEGIHPSMQATLIFPIIAYQGDMFIYFLEQFRLLLFFLVSALVLSFIIKRFLVNTLNQLTNSTTGLPMKLQTNQKVEWPESSLEEINKLTINFKHMSKQLNQLFQNGELMNQKLKAQTNILQKSEEKLFEFAYYDSLTGLPNRQYFQNTLRQLINKDKSIDDVIGVLFMDLNQFKQINDTLGHVVGDELLRLVAKKLNLLQDDYTRVFRLGGDEFVVIFQAKNKEEVIKLGDEIISIFSDPININGLSLYVTTSVGVSLYPTDGNDLDTLVKYADMAMYSAKEKGRNYIQFFDEFMKEELSLRMTLNHGLQEALLDEQFELYFQPKMKTSTGKLSSIEALIRWKHPELGYVSPAVFIPVAEETGLILGMDEWGLKTACLQNKKWQDLGAEKVPIAVNLSAKHFYHGQLIEMIKRALELSNLDPQYLQIEITESVFMKNLGEVIGIMERIRNMGVSISIDDFGSGYSSLSQLVNLPINEMKLDMEFIRGIDVNKKKASMVKLIVQLAHSLGLNVVAEGIETMEELEYLQQIHCDEVQGYLFSKPIPHDELYNKFYRIEV